MTRRISILAASSAAFVLALTACSTGPKSFAANVVTNEQGGARDERLARAAVKAGDLAAALGHAERAAQASPRDLGYRMLLGDLYLKNGRFASAEAAFRDVLQLSPDNARATFSLALAEIAVGKRHAALGRLDRLAETAPAADLGLAFALAGDVGRAVAILETAARTEGADARVRQNLALAYALAGDWQRARITAAQDLSPADLPARMAEWASFTQPGTPADQVAGLLGVKVAEDPGQPAQLALAPLEPEPVFEPVQEMPVAVAQAQPEPAPIAASVQQMSYVPDAAPVPLPVAVNAPAPAARAKPARYVVQLGAYANPASMKQGWSQLRRLYSLGGTPHGAAASVPGKGKVHRLSVGYPTQAEALRACRAIKGKGGACFVRGVSGDRPIQA